MTTVFVSFLDEKKLFCFCRTDEGLFQDLTSILIHQSSFIKDNENPCHLLGKGGYVFGGVGLSVCLSVCLFVCGQHLYKKL